MGVLVVFQEEWEAKKLDGMGKKHTLFATPQQLSKMDSFSFPCGS
jgi:hypothetical protein